MTRAEQILNKLAYLTQHGKERQIGKAKAYKHYADAAIVATEEFPGMGYIKGTPAKALQYTLLARRNA